MINKLKNKMSKIIRTEIILILFLIIYYVNSETEVYSIEKLEEFSIFKQEWKSKEKYIYYLDIEEYELNDEIVIQIITEDSLLVLNYTLYEINETYILNNKTSDIDIKKEKIITRNIKYRLKPKRFYNEILVKKKEENQKLYVFLLDTSLLLKNKTDFELIVSKKIPLINIQKSDISEGNCFSHVFSMDPKIEQFIKFNISNISLENHNLILYLNEQGVSSFYLGTLKGQKRKVTSLYIFEKNSTQDNNFIIYLSLIGQANKAQFQMKLDDHDIIYKYSESRKSVNHYIERLNCTNDFYIFESYFVVDDKIRRESYNLDVIPLYGDYEIFYYDIFNNYINDIEHLFSKENNNTKKIEGITPINSEISAIIVSCKMPSFIGIKYIGQNINLNISEGREITCTLEEKRYMNNFLFLKDLNKEYKFYFGFYKLPSEKNYYRAAFHSLKNFEPNKYYIK